MALNGQSEILNTDKSSGSTEKQIVNEEANTAAQGDGSVAVNTEKKSEIVSGNSSVPANTETSSPPDNTPLIPVEPEKEYLAPSRTVTDMFIQQQKRNSVYASDFELGDLANVGPDKSTVYTVINNFLKDLVAGKMDKSIVTEDKVLMFQRLFFTDQIENSNISGYRIGRIVETGNSAYAQVKLYNTDKFSIGTIYLQKNENTENKISDFTIQIPINTPVPQDQFEPEIYHWLDYY